MRPRAVFNGLKVAGKPMKESDGSMTYRGHAVSIPSEKIKSKVKPGSQNSFVASK